MAVARAVAAEAVRQGFGFGTQGLVATAIRLHQAGRPCYADWCDLFGRYAGRVPLEVQTYTHSNPDGRGPTGPLPELLSFALQQRAQIFELYPQEWLVANDPSFPGYSQYHEAYARALAAAAAVVGGAASDPAAAPGGGLATRDGVAGPRRSVTGGAARLPAHSWAYRPWPAMVARPAW